MGISLSRLESATRFLLKCHGCMHSFEVTRIICFVLEDVKNLILAIGMDYNSQMKVYSKLPFITVDELGFLKNKTSPKLDLTIINRDEMLLLFVVSHLSLNGRSNFEEVVKEVSTRTPTVIRIILTCASTSDRLQYFRKYPQYFQLGGDNYLELDRAFYFQFEKSSKNSVSSPKTDTFLRGEDVTALSNPDSQARVKSDDSKWSSIATEEKLIGNEHSEKNKSFSRLSTSVRYLLRCYESMHSLLMTKNISFVLKDVNTYLSGMCPISQMVLYSNVPFITMNKRGFLEKKSSSLLDLTIVTKDELLLLFIVSHLSLNDGKSHFEEVVQEVINRAPQVIRMILECESNSGRLQYFRKHPQYFQLDSDDNLELDRPFFSQFEGPIMRLACSPKRDAVLRCENATDLPNSDSRVSLLSGVSKPSNVKTTERERTEKKTSSDFSLNKYISRNWEMKVAAEMKSEVLNELARTGNGEAKSVKVGNDRDFSLTNKVLQREVNVEKFASETNNVLHQCRVPSEAKVTQVKSSIEGESSKKSESLTHKENGCMVHKLVYEVKALKVAEYEKVAKLIKNGICYSRVLPILDQNSEATPTRETSELMELMELGYAFQNQNRTKN